MRVFDARWLSACPDNGFHAIDNFGTMHLENDDSSSGPGRRQGAWMSIPGGSGANVALRLVFWRGEQRGIHRGPRTRMPLLSTGPAESSRPGLNFLVTQRKPSRRYTSVAGSVPARQVSVAGEDGGEQFSLADTTDGLACGGIARTDGDQQLRTARGGPPPSPAKLAQTVATALWRGWPLKLRSRLNSLRCLSATPPKNAAVSTTPE